jgi:hypothetical protein
MTRRRREDRLDSRSLSNAASIRVLGKIGMRFEEKTIEEGAAVEIWAQSRAEWEARRARDGD